MSTINLLPEEYVRQANRRRTNTLCLLLFFAVMGGVGATEVVSSRSYRHTQQVRERVDASYMEAARLIAQMRELEGKKTRMLQKAEETSSLLERVPRSYILALVTNALPEQASLREVNLQHKKVVKRGEEAVSPRKPMGKSAKAIKAADVDVTTTLTLRVTGWAATDVDVARFMTNLSHSVLIASVDLVYSEEKITQKTIKTREFQVDAVVRTDLDVIDVLHAGVPAGPAERLARAPTEVRP